MLTAKHGLVNSNDEFDVTLCTNDGTRVTYPVIVQFGMAILTIRQDVCIYATN